MGDAGIVCGRVRNKDSARETKENEITNIRQDKDARSGEEVWILYCGHQTALLLILSHDEIRYALKQLVKGTAVYKNNIELRKKS